MAKVRSQPIYCDVPEAVGDAVMKHLGRHRLLRGVSRLGLAVSGGADSVALFHLLVPLCRAEGISVAVLHADHGLREESHAEAEFVCALAASHGVPCLTEELRLGERRADGNSLEMVARDARLSFFARCCDQAELDAVATGHQADDVAETVLLRLARGAGCAGLSALRPRSPASPALALAAGRPFSLIRPLLPVSARALRAWLTARGFAWCEDASNRSCEIPRNLVRHRLLPQLEAAWGGALRANLCRSADILRSEDALLDDLAERRMKSVCSDGALDLRRLKRLPEALRRRVMRLWLFSQSAAEACGFESVSRLLDLCEEHDGARLQLPGGSGAIIDGHRLVLADRDPLPLAELPVSVPGRTQWGSLEILVESSRGIVAEARGIGRYPAACTIGADTLGAGALTVRPRRPGDRIHPTGMAGSKKLQDLFTDAKVPQASRDGIPVFVCGDEVVWVPGCRVSRRFRVPAPNAPSLRLTVRPLDRNPREPTSTAQIDLSRNPERASSRQRTRSGR